MSQVPGSRGVLSFVFAETDEVTHAHHCGYCLIPTLHQPITVSKHTFYCILLSTAHIQSWWRTRGVAELFLLWLTRLLLLLFTRHEQALVIQWLEGIWPRDTILDTTNKIGVPIFDSTDVNWESWRMKFEPYADLANMGAHLDLAAEQTSFITQDGLDANSVTKSKTVHASLITKCEGKALPLVSFVPRRFGVEAWRVLKEVYEGKVENAQQRP